MNPVQQSLASHSRPTDEAEPGINIWCVRFDQVGIGGGGDKEKFHTSSEPVQYFSTVSAL